MLTLVCALALMNEIAAPDWAPQKAPLMTRWAKDVGPTSAHPEYPRPTMVRKAWMSLNGLWDLSIQTPEPATHGPKPTASVAFDGKILVPFPVESALSGVMRAVGPTDELVYRREFDIPSSWKGKRILLHFGAVDWECHLSIDGREVGSHRGGYDPFQFDITEFAELPGPHELKLRVIDPTDRGTQPRGKQVLRPEGIWYTPTSGIWQSVWLEPVAQTYIADLKIANRPDGSPTVNVECSDPRALIRMRLFDGKKEVSNSGVRAASGWTFILPDPHKWSPEDPFLYRLEVEVVDQPSNRVLDKVESYVAFRSFTLGKDGKGRTKFLLNGKPYFVIGPLDQGFWPDGLYTPPTDAAMKYDLEVTKKLGFNMIRKHVKVESPRWYTWCDRLGILVFQDMPSGDKYIGGPDPDITRSQESGDNFKTELKALIETHWNHPSIVAWVPYNEGWGQWDTPGITEFIRKLDPTRLIDNPSGWTDRGVGDMHDIHAYPGPASPKPEAKRAAFLGEFGGLGLPMPGHMWKSDGWGYRSFKTKADLTEGLVGLLQNLRFLIDEPGLSGAVYTQTTDVEQEINGLMTYDRAVIKPDAGAVARAVKALFLPPPVIRPVIPTSEEGGIEWQYRTELGDAADLAWTTAKDNAGWKSGAGGFGTTITPGAVVRTEWNTPDIWIRREFLLPKVAMKSPHLRIHHDEDVEVYLDGTLLLKRSGYTTGYVLVPIAKAEAKRLTPGRHTLAVHCRQTGGGQYVDVGIVDVRG